MKATPLLGHNTLVIRSRVTQFRRLGWDGMNRE
jgi:hypothetical protein